MVGAGEEELCPAGNGAKTANTQLVAVDGVVVEHIVLLETSGVLDKVVVHGKVPHLDVGVGDDALEVNGLPVVGAGIDSVIVCHGMASCSGWDENSVPLEPAGTQSTKHFGEEKGTAGWAAPWGHFA